MPHPSLTTRPLRRDDWPTLERLFGARGACGGCWCMYWRLAKGERWDDVKGPPARGRFRALVERGDAHGVLAFVDETPVGWASVDRRTDYEKLDRAPSLACDDADQVWSVPCFFIHREHRGQGVASALLGAAEDLVRALGGRLLEGYPAQPTSAAKLPAAFAWTGVPALFEKHGFVRVEDKPKGKVRMRKTLAGPRPKRR